MNLERGFSGLCQGASGKAVFVRYSWLSELTIARLRSGISPNLVLSEAKDMIDILLPGPATCDGGYTCFLTIGDITGSIASDSWGFGWPNFRLGDGSLSFRRLDF
jgi:hypothetical protein